MYEGCSSITPAFAAVVEGAQQHHVLYLEELFGLIMKKISTQSIYVFRLLSASVPSTFLAPLSDSLPRKMFVKIICYNKNNASLEIHYWIPVLQPGVRQTRRHCLLHAAAKLTTKVTPMLILQELFLESQLPEPNNYVWLATSIKNY